MSRALRGSFVLCAFVALTACGEPIENGSERVRWLDRGEYTAKIQPLFAETCSNPSCHARPDRPFSLYAPLARRIDPNRTHLLEPLTEAELEHNYVVSCVFASEGGETAQSLLLRKPLAEHAAAHHGGGAVFDGRSDDRYQKLEDWVTHGGDP
ncbi:MAG: hypothetical protein IPI67_32755 [Myxococcales bacterium]|nr:hypothetical protein [Myxococcales bacterium]